MALQVNSDRLQRCSVDLNVQRACSQQRSKQVLKMIGCCQAYRNTVVHMCVLNHGGRTK